MKIFSGRLKGGFYRSSAPVLLNSYNGITDMPSVANLDPALTINGITVYPTLRYKGGDAGAGGWAPWGYGPTLALQAGTAPTYNDGSPFLGASDDAVKGNAGGYFQAPDATVFVGDEDVAVEVVWKSIAGTAVLIEQIKNGFADYWHVINNGGWKFDIAQGSTLKTIEFPAIADGTYNHAMIFLDRSGSGIVYANSVAGTAVNISAVSSALATDRAATVMARYGGSLQSNASLAYLSLWKRASWLDTHLQAAVAKDRFLRLCGALPLIASGTATPTAFGSSSPAYQLKSSASKLYYMGASVQRFETPAAGFTGLLNEGQVQNLWLNSRDVSGYSFTGVTFPTTAVVTPDGTTRTTNTVNENGATSHHRMYVNIDPTPGSVYVWGAIVKYVARQWIYLRNATVGTLSWYDIKNGVKGADGSGLTGGIVPMGNGYYLVWQRYTAPAGAGQSHIFGAAAADGDDAVTTVVGVNGDAWIADNFFCHLGAYPARSIPTAAGAVTKAADSYILPAASNVGTTRGGVRFRFCAPSGWTPTARRTLVSINDGSSANRIDVFVHTDGTLCAESRKAAGADGDIAIAGTVLDGLVHDVLCNWDVSSLTLFKDGTPTTDTTADIPASPTQISLGQDAAAATNAGPIVVGGFKFYGRPARW